jgi:putative ABC transport system permease protein
MKTGVSPCSPGFEGASGMNTILQDLRYAVRMLYKSPAFTAFAVGVLALGIAANTSIFSFANTVMLRPFPYRDAGRLVMVWEDFSYIGFPKNTPAPGNFYTWKSQNRTFEDMAATFDNSFSLTGGAQPEEVEAKQATWNLFGVLGVKPVMGRDFLPEDDRPGANHVVILSHALWRETFGSDPHLIGRTIQLDGASWTVIGVMPSGFEYLNRDIRVWVPAALPDDRRSTHESHFLRVVGRLKPGVTLGEANADLRTIASQLAKEYPKSNAHVGAFAVPLRTDVVGNLRLAIFVLLGAVAFVLLIACANVANLLLARATSRHRELAVRMALRAGRSRILRQLLTESVLLAAIAGTLGCMLSLWGAAFFARVIPDGIPRAADSGIDARVLEFTLVVTLATGILFGIIPALRVSRANLSDSLKQAGGRSGLATHGHRTRDVFVVCEVALAMVLLAGAGLMIESFVKLRALNPGFHADHVLILRVPLPDPKYADMHKRTAFYDAVLERVNHLQGVVAAGFTTWVPLTNKGGSCGFTIEGRPVPAPGELNDANTRVVSKDYMPTMGMTLKAGRLFGDGDREGNSPVALVNETMAHQFWAHEDPLGHRIKLGDADSKRPWNTIVGIVGDVHQMGFDVPARAEMYYSYAQQEVFQPEYLAVRASGDPLQLANAVRDQIWAVDKEQPVENVLPMEAIVEEELAPRKMQATVLGAFGGLALLLASLGIYAVLSYAVAQRTQEIGVRIALGAQPHNVLQMVIGQGLGLTAIGVAVGMTGALALTRVLGNLLYGMSATDPATFAGVALVLSAVAIVACYIPARRAMRVDPIVALRYE